MKLSFITESKRLEANEIVDELKKYGVKASSYSEHVVNVKSEPQNVDKIKAFAKHVKWQVHRVSSESKGFVYLDLTPLKNTEIKLNKILYHVTEKKFLNDILENGLRVGSNTPGMNFPKRIYLHSSIEKASTWYHAADKLGLFANKKGFVPVMLSVDNKNGRYKTFVDPEYYMGMGGDGDIPVYVSKNIHPKDISVVDSNIIHDTIKSMIEN